MSNGNECHGDEDDYIPPPEYDEETDLKAEELEYYRSIKSQRVLYQPFYLPEPKGTKE